MTAEHETKCKAPLSMEPCLTAHNEDGPGSMGLSW